MYVNSSGRKADVGEAWVLPEASQDGSSMVCAGGSGGSRDAEQAEGCRTSAIYQDVSFKIFVIWCIF